jgi:sporulation protein YqfC
MLKRIRNYIKNNDFSINIWSDSLYVNNFTDIISLENECVILSYYKGTLIIKGDNITIKKLSYDEILLYGNIKEIKLGE